MDEVFICPICKREFQTKYWEYGYINHRNFISNIKSIMKSEKSVAYNIVTDGSKIQPYIVAKELLYCFREWLLKNNISLSIYELTEQKVLQYYTDYELLENYRLQASRNYDLQKAKLIQNL